MHEVAGLSAELLRAYAESNERDDGALLVVHPSAAQPSALAPLLERAGKHGFVVVDMQDVDSFLPIESVTIPDAPLYVLRDVTRGDEMANWSPDEALPAITAAGRTPMTTWLGFASALERVAGI